MFYIADCSCPILTMCFYIADCSCPILTMCFYIADCSWVHTAVEIFDDNILFLFLYIYTCTSYRYISTYLLC